MLVLFNANIRINIEHSIFRIVPLLDFLRYIKQTVMHVIDVQNMYFIVETSHLFVT